LNSNFIDVDDAKEEKVELCLFENVNGVRVVVVPLRRSKKRKKKKLLQECRKLS